MQTSKALPRPFTCNKGAYFEKEGRGGEGRNRCHILAKRLPCHYDVQTVCCTSMLPLGHPAPQFGVSFTEKLLKIVATRGEIFSLKFTK